MFWVYACPFLMKSVTKVIPCGFRNGMIHVIGLKSLNQKTISQKNLSPYKWTAGHWVSYISFFFKLLTRLVSFCQISLKTNRARGMKVRVQHYFKRHSSASRTTDILCIYPHLLSNFSSMMSCGQFFQKQYSSSLCDSLQITSPSFQIMNKFKWIPLLVFIALFYTRIARSMIFWWFRHSVIQLTHPIFPALHSSTSSPPRFSL